MAELERAPGVEYRTRREAREAVKSAPRSARRETRRSARAEAASRPPASRRSRGRRRARRHAPATQRLGEGLLSLPWVTFVLISLIVLAAVDVLGHDEFTAASTISAPTERAAQEAAASLARPDLTDEVEKQVELDDRWQGSVALSVHRPGEEAVVQVRAAAPDPRLAALAADTAAAMAVEADDELALTDAAVVPTEPVDQTSWWRFLVGGASALALALVLEHWHLRRTERAAKAARAEREAAAASPTTAAGVGGDLR